MRPYLYSNDGFERKTVAFFTTDQRRRDDIVGSLYGYMLLGDVRSQVMPIGGRSRERPDFSINLEPDDTTVRTIIADAVDHSDNYGWRDLTEELCDFIENVAQYLAAYGKSYYEIVRRSPPGGTFDSKDEKDGSMDPRRFLLTHIPGRVVQLGRSYLQILPRSEWAHIGKRFVLLPQNDVWSVQLPKLLGTPHRQRSMLRTLARAGDSMPNFALESMRKDKQVPGFNVRDHRKQQAIIAAREVAAWGWAARGLWDEYTVEYFRIDRRLRFARSLALVREHILSSLNDLLLRLNFASQLRIKNLPTAQEISGLIEKLQNGDISFQEAVDAMRF